MQGVLESLVGLATNNHPLNRFVSAREMLLHPPDVPQELANCLIRRLLALQLYDKPSTLSPVLREQVDSSYVAGIL